MTSSGPTGLRFAVVGTGAMGGAVATLLAHAGEDVLFIDRDEAVVARVEADGFHVRGALGDFSARVAVARQAPGDRHQTVDVAIVLTTTNDTPAAAATVAKLLKDDGLAVTMQNGIGNIEVLQETLGAARVAGGSTKSSAQRIAPGISDITKVDPTTIGALGAGQAEKVRALVAALDGAGFTALESDNILGVIWSKLIHNVAINPLCAATGLVQAEVAKIAELEELRGLAVGEALAVARAKGIALADPDPLDKLRRHTAAKHTRPSMLQHFDAGRPTEIDAINGAIVREGRVLGVPTPANLALVAIIKGRERAQEIAIGTSIAE